MIEGETLMFEILFMIGMLWVFGKLLVFGIKAAWGMTKLLFTVVFLPVVLFALVLGGLITLALPLLIIIGIISFILK